MFEKPLMIISLQTYFNPESSIKQLNKISQRAQPPTPARFT
ncbi:hypothetical protein SeSB_A0568 [Salmonella enterica subsp. enterica serovar Schwarzengrund str. SL480]|uniref:Uncharacterized protein n=1 Tax=Salmonella schwarzengrund (strain CVM19633) TaxID=439843 RepID=A0A0N1QWS7_SALSV|nr:hypothetical protein SeSA_A0385 [Salmonella enterica subsp. enterica serovar Schwarzengrund str. CVM19633]EDY27147.1 hypothetical protein SeSB_A0568 [Salmonella enterica subsp. enterica serovar Schwarzengrund str. SL480]